MKILFVLMIFLTTVQAISTVTLPPDKCPGLFLPPIDYSDFRRSMIGSLGQIGPLVGGQNYVTAINGLAAFERPHFLVAGVEFGRLDINGLVIQGKVGGLGTVFQDWIEEFPKWASANGGGQASFAFMGFEGVPWDKLAFMGKMSIPMGSMGSQTVEVFLYDHPAGGHIYFLRHPIFERRSLASKKVKRKVNGQDVTVTLNLYDAPRPEWAQLYSHINDEMEIVWSWALYGKAIAQLRQLINANIVHLNDYHTAFTPFFLGPDVIWTQSLHNGGYGGDFWIHGFGGQTRYDPNLGMVIRSLRIERR